MMTMFKPSKGEKRKAVVTEFNSNLNKMFDEFFSANYPSAREELLRSGVTEEYVDQKLLEIKQATQQRMIIEAQRLLQEKLTVLAQEKEKSSTTTSSSVDESKIKSLK